MSLELEHSVRHFLEMFFIKTLDMYHRYQTMELICSSWPCCHYQCYLSSHTLLLNRKITLLLCFNSQNHLHLETDILKLEIVWLKKKKKKTWLNHSPFEIKYFDLRLKKVYLFLYLMFTFAEDPYLTLWEAVWEWKCLHTVDHLFYTDRAE